MDFVWLDCWDRRKVPYARTRSWRIRHHDSTRYRRGSAGRILGESIRIISRGRPDRLRDGRNRLGNLARALSDVWKPISSVTAHSSDADKNGEIDVAAGKRDQLVGEVQLKYRRRAYPNHWAGPRHHARAP